MNDNILKESIINKTLKIIISNQKKIKHTRNKEIVVFFGPEQIGKSTTINSLRGQEFKLIEINDMDVENIDKDGELEVCNNIDNQAPMGTYEKKGQPCTLYPIVYCDSKFNCLDTQGLNATIGDDEKIVASSLLMQIALKKAKSIRLIFLSDFNDFKSGYSKYHENLKKVSNYLNNSNVSVLFLFNRFKFPPNITDWNKKSELISKLIESSAKKIKESISNTKNEKYERFKDLIKKFVDDKEQSKFEQENRIEELMKIIENKVNDDNEIKELENLVIGIKDIEFNECVIEKNFFNNKNYCYIEPWTKSSIENLKNKIEEMEKVNYNDMAFNLSSDERKKFDMDFSIVVNNSLVHMKKVIFSLKYPSEEVQNIIKRKESEKIKHEENLKKLNNKEETLDLKEYSEILNTKIENEKELKTTIYEKVKLIENAIHDISQSEPVHFKTIVLEKKLLSYKPTHSFEITEFVKIEEELEKGTNRTDLTCFNKELNISSKQSDHLEIIEKGERKYEWRLKDGSYYEGITVDYQGVSEHNTINVNLSLELEKILGDTLKKIREEKKEDSSVDLGYEIKKYLWISGSILIGIISAPIWIPATVVLTPIWIPATVAGFVEEYRKTVGVLRIFGDPNKVFKHEISNLESLRNKYNEILENETKKIIELIDVNGRTLGEQIQGMIKNAQEELEEFSKIKSFVEDTERFYDKKKNNESFKNLIDSYKLIISLYDEKNFKNFLEMYEKIQIQKKVKVSPDDFEIRREFSIL